LDKNKEISIECECGCGITTLKFEKDNWEGIPILEISNFQNSFYAEQQPIRKAIANRLRMIWCGITGKQYHLYDIILTGEKVEEFMNELREFVSDSEAVDQEITINIKDEKTILDLADKIAKNLR
jgi:hypothetical protein